MVEALRGNASVAPQARGSCVACRSRRLAGVITQRRGGRVFFISVVMDGLHVVNAVPRQIFRACARRALATFRSRLMTEKAATKTGWFAPVGMPKTQNKAGFRGHPAAKLPSNRQTCLKRRRSFWPEATGNLKRPVSRLARPLAGQVFGGPSPRGVEMEIVRRGRV